MLFCPEDFSKPYNLEIFLTDTTFEILDIFHFNKPLQGNPTIFDNTHGNFNARCDAEALHKAMEGVGTDEDTLIKILGHRTNSQRIKIAETYKALYGKVSPSFVTMGYIKITQFQDLKDELKSELSGDFRKVMLAMITPHIEFYAEKLHHAMSGPGTTEEVLIEFMATSTNSEIMAIRQEYERSKYIIHCYISM